MDRRKRSTQSHVVSRTAAAVLPALLGLSTPATAQDAVMGTSGVPRSDTLRITAYPAASLEGDGAVGLLGKAAYGLDDRLAVDARLGLYGDLWYLGAQARLVALEAAAFDLTLGAGVHRSDFEGPVDVLGFDALPW